MPSAQLSAHITELRSFIAKFGILTERTAQQEAIKQLQVALSATLTEDEKKTLNALLTEIETATYPMLATVEVLELYVKKMEQYVNKWHVPVLLKTLQKKQTKINTTLEGDSFLINFLINFFNNEKIQQLHSLIYDPEYIGNNPKFFMLLLDDIEKKLLLASDYYPAFVADNRALLTRARDFFVQKFKEHGVFQPKYMVSASRKILESFTSILVEKSRASFLSMESIVITIDDIDHTYAQQFKVMVLKEYAHLITQLTALIQNNVLFADISQAQITLIEDINKIESAEDLYPAKAQKITDITNNNTLKILQNKELENLLRTIEVERMLNALNPCLQIYAIASTNEDFPYFLIKFASYSINPENLKLNSQVAVINTMLRVLRNLLSKETIGQEKRQEFISSQSPLLIVTLTELNRFLNNINLEQVALNVNALESLSDIWSCLNIINLPENSEYKIYIEGIKKIINEMLAEIKHAQPVPAITAAQQETPPAIHKPTGPG